MLKVACKLLQWSIRLQAKFVKVCSKNFYHQRKPLLLLLSGKTHLMTQAAQQAHWQHWHRFKRLHAFHKSERNAYTLVAVIVAEQFCIMTTMAPPRKWRQGGVDAPQQLLGVRGGADVRLAGRQCRGFEAGEHFLRFFLLQRRDDHAVLAGLEKKTRLTGRGVLDPGQKKVTQRAISIQHRTFDLPPRKATRDLHTID